MHNPRCREGPVRFSNSAIGSWSTIAVHGSCTVAPIKLNCQSVTNAGLNQNDLQIWLNMCCEYIFIYIYIYNFLWCTITIHTHLHTGMHTYIHIYTCMHAYAHLTVIPPYLHPNSIASRSWSRRSRTWAAIDGVELICRLLFKTFGSTRSMKSYIYTYIYYLLHHTIGPKMHNLR